MCVFDKCYGLGAGLSVPQALFVTGGFVFRVAILRGGLVFRKWGPWVVGAVSTEETMATLKTFCLNM